MAKIIIRGWSQVGDLISAIPRKRDSPLVSNEWTYLLSGNILWLSDSPQNAPKFLQVPCLTGKLAKNKKQKRKRERKKETFKNKIKEGKIRETNSPFGISSVYDRVCVCTKFSNRTTCWMVPLGCSGWFRSVGTLFSTEYGSFSLVSGH